MTKRWTEADHEFLRDNVERMDIQALAHRLGARVDEVEAKLEKLGLRKESASAAPAPASFREMFRHSEAARKEYEKGVAALQRKKFDDAEKHLRAVIEQFGDEKELADRARLYLAVCEKRKAPSRNADGQDPYYLGLFEKNRGNYELALEHLKKAARRADGHVSFLIACCHAQLNEPEKAIEALERAILVDENNRGLARRDSDLSPLKELPQFQQLIAATA